MSFKRLHYVFTVVMLLSLLSTCQMDTGLGPASPAGLPADKVLDVARSFSVPFAYETLLPVALNLTVELYQQPNPAAALERQAAGSQLIIVSLWNEKGEALYSGSVPSSGTLTTVLSLPAAPQDVVLRLESPGFESREVTIDGMVLYSEIKRIMGLLSEGMSAKSDLLADSDQDGVPDIYDVDPLDPEAAFKVRTPASGHFTVSYEDLYPVPGDADYNDFVANYFVVENYMSEVPKEHLKEGGVEPLAESNDQPVEVTLQNLHGEAKAKAKVAGYNHKFGIVIEFPGLQGVKVRRKYYNSSGTLQETKQPDIVDNRAVIWLFENTKYAVEKTATFDIVFPNDTTRSMVSIAPYDPVLLVLNTGEDIHMVGRNPLDGQASSLAEEQSYMDPNGYPWALLVPEDWQYPAETQYIGKAYPLFDEWRASKGAVAPYWYLYPASTSNKPGNNPPSKVSSKDSTQLVAGSNLTQEFHLSSVDPDGDPVTFMSSPAPLVLEELFHLKADTGLVWFDPGVPQGDYLFYFWSVDTWGASTLTTPFKVTFSFHGKTANTPPQVSFYDLQASKAGTTAVDGYYRENGANEGRPKYAQVGGNYSLYFFTSNDDPVQTRWVIHTSIFPKGSASLGDTTYYATDSTATTAPTGTWNRANGEALPPELARVAITGDLSVGSVLTGAYNYSDVESDVDASTYQWKRYSSSTDTGAGTNCSGAGATTLKYTVNSSDNGQYLRLQVTPADDSGATGAQVLSGAVRIN